MKKLFFLLLIFVSVNTFSAPKEVSIQKDNGDISWNGKKITGEHFGKVEISSGHLKFNYGELSGGKIEVDMRSISCEDIKDKEYNSKLVNHLRSDDFFSTEKYPKAIFEITSVMPAKGANYDVSGKLTIKGITKPIKFKVNKMDKKEKWQFKGDLVFDRTEFDIKFKSKKFFEALGDKVIYDDVMLSFNLGIPKDLIKN